MQGVIAGAAPAAQANAGHARDVTAAAASDTSHERLLLRLLLAVLLVRLATLGLYPLFDNTEARYALIALNMLDAGGWVTPLIEPGVPFWAKPPLSSWFIVASYHLFGVSEWAARLPSFLFTVATAALVYRLGVEGRDRPFGLLAALIFSTSFMAFYLAGGVMTDPALLFAAALCMAGHWLAVGAGRPFWGYAFFVGCGLAMLAKGPVGVVLAGLAIAPWTLWRHAWRDTWRRLPWLTGTLLALAICLPWYVLAELRTPGFLSYFIVGEHIQRFLQPGWTGDLYGAGRAHPIGTIWLFAVLAWLPWSGLLPALLVRSRYRAKVLQVLAAVRRDPWLSYLAMWCLAPLLLFTLARNILITYIATAVPAFALLTTHLLRQAGFERPRAIVALSLVMPVVLLAVVFAWWMAPRATWWPTQKNIVADYASHRSGDGSLVYLYVRPASAQFYSRNRADLVRTVDALDRRLAVGESLFIALRSRSLDTLPQAFRRRLDIVATANGTTLLKSIPSP